MKTEHEEIGSLNSEEIVKVFESGCFGHLGCYANGEVYIVPITYVYSDGYLYSHSQLGKKIEIMRDHPKICIQVEEVQNYFQWKSVIGWGHYEELDNDEAVTAMRLLINRIVKSEGVGGKVTDFEVDVKAMFDTAIIYRMKIEKSTGRFETFGQAELGESNYDSPAET